MFKIKVPFVCVLVACTLQMNCAGEVYNGGAERGDLGGWPAFTDGVAAVMQHTDTTQSQTYFPRSGDYMFSMAAGPNVEEHMTYLGPTFSSPQTGQFTLRGFVQTDADDRGIASLVLTTDGPTFVEGQSGFLTSSDGWSMFEVEINTDEPVTGWVIELDGQQIGAGDTNVFWDDISITVPEPTSFLLAGWLAAVLMHRFRR